MYRKLSIAVFSLLVIFNVGCHQKSKHSDTNPPEGDGQIKINVEIPVPPSSIPLYKLTATHAPVDFLNEKLEMVKLPTLTLDKKNYVVRSGSDKEGFNAFIDLRSGDAEFIPNLAKVVKTATNRKVLDSVSALRLARVAFTD